MANKFLIIVPVYNTNPEILLQCLDTLLKQTYKAWRCIIVDDKSTNISTLQFLDNFVSEHKEFTYVKNITNVGCGESRNIGLSQATEHDDLIWFVDSDDYLTTSALEIANSYFTQYPNLEILSFTCINLLLDNNYSFQVTYAAIGPSSVENDHKLLACSVGVWSYIMKLSFIKKHILYFPHQKFFQEDLYFWILCFSRAKHILSINDYMYIYRFMLPNSMSNSWDEVTKVSDNLKAIKTAYEVIKNDSSYISEHFGELFDLFFYQRIKQFHNVENNVQSAIEYKKILMDAADFQLGIKKASH